MLSLAVNRESRGGENPIYLVTVPSWWADHVTLTPVSGYGAGSSPLPEGEGTLDPVGLHLPNLGLAHLFAAEHPSLDTCVIMHGTITEARFRYGWDEGPLGVGRCVVLANSGASQPEVS